MAHIDYTNGYYDGDVNYNGKPHGYGTLCWDNGNKYVGEWRNDKQTGYGVFTWNSGNRYEGNWVDDKPTGYGTYYCTNGNRYEGNFVDSTFNGQGTYYCSNGSRYEGNWVDSNRNGQGTMFYSNGNKYEGEWRNNKQNGRGKLTLADGTVFSGVFDGNNATSVVCIKSSERLPLPGRIENGKFIPDGLPKREEGEKVTSKKGEYGQFSYDSGAYSTTYFDGKKVYFKNGLFSFSKENQDLMKNGNAPIGADGYPIELHHITQMDDSAIVELLYTVHKGYTRTLHNPYQEYSGINRPAFTSWKKQYWIHRLNEYLNN